MAALTAIRLLVIPTGPLDHVSGELTAILSLLKLRFFREPGVASKMTVMLLKLVVLFGNLNAVDMSTVPAPVKVQPSQEPMVFSLNV